MVKSCRPSGRDPCCIVFTYPDRTLFKRALRPVQLQLVGVQILLTLCKQKRVVQIRVYPAHLYLGTPVLRANVVSCRRL